MWWVVVLRVSFGCLWVVSYVSICLLVVVPVAGGLDCLLICLFLLCFTLMVLWLIVLVIAFLLVWFRAFIVV